MREEAAKLLAKSARAIHSAEVLLREGEPDFSGGRAYYAMFYATEALLCERGLRFRKHTGVHAAFGEHFAKPGLVDPKYHRWLLNSYDKRREGDYGLDVSLNAEEAEELISQAREFLAMARDFLSTM